MSMVGEHFASRFGPPSPAAASGIEFDCFTRHVWKDLHEEIGAGFYLDGFLYLFGEGLAPLGDCLPPWSFLLPRMPAPMVVGYNAFGSLLVLRNRKNSNSTVGVLDPARVIWWDPKMMLFVNLIGAWLPDNAIPYFLDQAPYEAWRRAGGRRLAVGEMLSLKTPAALGGAFEPDNFEIADILSYYRASGPVYEKTVQAAAPKSPGAAPKGRGARKKK